MNELDSIVEAWRSDSAAVRAGVLATVVHVKGSAYRRPGARMLIMQDGGRIGSISGGCLEGDVAKKAWWLTEAGRPVLRTYDTTSDDDAVWEFGLGCNGVVEVLLERIDDARTRRMLGFIAQCRRSGGGGVMATAIRSPETGARLYLNADGAIEGELNDGTLIGQAREAMRARKSRLVNCGGCEIFVEWVGPPVHLTIFGAGHDAIPLVAFAKESGWYVTVADSRPAYLKQSRFPRADLVLAVDCVDVDRESVVILMTHNYPQDRELLRRIVPMEPRYLGMLGPAARAERMLRDLGMSPRAANLHAPVGLDIGAETPEAIALSIVAEIHAALAGRAAGMLKDRRGPIYEPVHEVAA